MKSGNLNFLETFGPLQACNGTALPFTIIYYSLHGVVVLRSSQICPWRVTVFRTREVHVNRNSQRCFRFKFVTLVALVSYYLSSSFHDAVEKRKLDTGIKLLLWPTLDQPSACVHHSVACISVHPPRKDKMAITLPNNIQIRKLHLTTRSPSPSWEAKSCPAI